MIASCVNDGAPGGAICNTLRSTARGPALGLAFGCGFTMRPFRYAAGRCCAGRSVGARLPLTAVNRSNVPGVSHFEQICVRLVCFMSGRQAFPLSAVITTADLVKVGI